MPPQQDGQPPLLSSQEMKTSPSLERTPVQAVAIPGLLQVAAPAAMGEITYNLPPAIFSVNQANNLTISPINILSGSFSGFFKNIGAGLKQPLKWLPALLLSCVWMVLMLLEYAGNATGISRVLSYLTFAQGGLDGGFGSIAGGLIGNGVIAMLATALFTKNTWTRMGTGLKNIFGKKTAEPSGGRPAFFYGVASALLFYNLVAGWATLADSMVALAAVLLSLAALGSSGGFLKNFLASFSAKKMSAAASRQTANRWLSGMTAGFGLAVVLSAVPFGYVCCLVGLVFLVAALILAMLESGKQKAVVR